LITERTSTETFSSRSTGPEFANAVTGTLAIIILSIVAKYPRWANYLVTIWSAGRENMPSALERTVLIAALT